MIQLVNGCDPESYEPEVTSFRPYDADDARHIPEALMNELKPMLKSNSWVMVYQLIDPETWVYPTFSYADGNDTVELLFDLENKYEFEIWMKDPDLLEPYRKRVLEAHIEKNKRDRELRENAALHAKRARVQEGNIEREIMLEVLSNNE